MQFIRHTIALAAVVASAVAFAAPLALRVAGSMIDTRRRRNSWDERHSG